MAEPDTRRDPSLFEPVGRRRIFEDVLEQLEKLIDDGRLAPGDRLPGERELSSAMEVSRTSLREALRVLEAMGIITVRTGTGPGSGSVMNREVGPAIARLMSLYMKIGHFSTDDLLDLRRVLGSHAVGLAALHRSDEQLALMRDIRDDMELAAGDPLTYYSLNSKIAVLMASASGNRLVAHLVAATNDPTEVYLAELAVETSAWSDFSQQAQTSLTRLIDAIESGDAAQARLAHDERAEVFHTLRSLSEKD